MSEAASAAAEIEFVPVPGFDGYEVTRDGRIRNFRGKLKFIQTEKRTGHCYVLYQRGGSKPRKLWVHRAVLLAYVGMPELGQECRHLDGKPKNNWIRNLKWGTGVENSEDMVRHGTVIRGEDSCLHKLTEHDVIEIRNRYACGDISHKALGEQYGVCEATIGCIIRGVSWKHLPGIDKRNKVNILTDDVISELNVMSEQILSSPDETRYKMIHEFAARSGVTYSAISKRLITQHKHHVKELGIVANSDGI